MLTVKLISRGHEFRCPHCLNWTTDIHDIPDDGYIRCGYCQGMYIISGGPADSTKPDLCTFTEQQQQQNKHCI